MDYRNADGIEGRDVRQRHPRLRALSRSTPGWATRSTATPLAIGTRAGVQDADPQRPRASRSTSAPGASTTARRSCARAASASPRPGLGIDVGNPHVVVALPDADELDGLDLAACPQLHPEPPHGANVEFVVPSDPLVHDGVGSIRMRVFERGVGETLSCGTGVAAAALAVRHWAGPAAPDRWTVEVPGGTLGVRMLAGRRRRRTSLLSGPATLVYSGEVTLA